MSKLVNNKNKRYLKTCYNGRMNEVVPGTYIDLRHINTATFQGAQETRAAQKTDCQITFEKIGQTLRAVRHIPVSFA